MEETVMNARILSGIAMAMILTAATPGGGLVTWSNLEGAGAGAAFLALAFMLFYGTQQRSKADKATQ